MRALLCFLLLSWAQIVHAGPVEELESARKVFLAGQYEDAIAQFSALLYPTSRLAGTSHIAEAHLLLGVSFFETSRVDSAKREFEEALFLDGDLSLDAKLFSDKAVRFFTAFKSDLKQKAEAAAIDEQLAKRQRALNRAFQNLVVFEKRRYWVNFIPFGAGQFQNGQKRKGTAFFIAEALTGGATIGLWSYQVIRYGFGGQVPLDEVNTVNTLQILQVGSGALFYALVAWGIVDSLSNYEHTIKREADPAMRKELEDIFTPKNPAILQSSQSLDTSYRGISFSWDL